MTSTYTSNQGIEKPATGDQSGTWGGTVNTNMDIIDRAISGVGALTLTGSTTTLTTTDGTLTDGMYRVLVLGDGGDLGSDNTLTISPNDQDKAYLVYNNLTANRNAIFTQGTGANATVANGATAWIYADGAGSGAAVRVAMLSTEISDQDGDTKIQVEEGGDDDDTIRFDIAGAEDFTMTANTFTALSGSDIAIASGATITNSGTATGFGADAERAISGVLQTNANFVDQVIFGPAVDGMPWNGAWSKASVFSSLMLATIETSGGSSELNVFDLTEQSAGAISTTPLYTVAIGVTATSVDAAMGYVVIGSSDAGVKFYDPHDGAWAQRTVGWPRYLSTSSTPALTSNDVTAVAAGLSSTSPLDPRTGGPMPVFACAYGTGADVGSLIKYDGNVWDLAATIGPETVCGFVDDRIALAQENSGNQVLASTTTIDLIVADDWGVSAYSGDNNTQQFSLGANTAATFHNADSVFADTTGLTIRRNDFLGSTAAMQGVSAMINRTFNTGFLINYTKGAWLANSKTVDRSGNANTLTENGTVTEAAVESSAELNGYSGWTTSNYLRRAHDTDMDFGTADFALSTWFKTSTSGVNEVFISVARPSAGDTNGKMHLYLQTTSKMLFYMHNSTSGGAADSVESPGTLDDGVWHKVDAVRDTTASKLFMYIDGVLAATDEGPLTSDTLTDASSTTNIGVDSNGAFPATNTTLSLFRLSTTIPTATQVRQMYDAEKGMFVASAECLLQSGSTDAVLDVDVDPLTSKVIVTQTDAITVFDGLVVDSKPTVNSGNSEKGKLWGALRAEQNSANAYVTAPATDQRQVNEMVRGLASDLPAGVDLGKAKAWIKFVGSGTVSISSSYNIATLTDNGTGDYTVTFAVPFKTDDFVFTAGGSSDRIICMDPGSQTGEGNMFRIRTSSSGSSSDAALVYAAFFGELENE